jgi:hypothetical protein
MKPTTWKQIQERLEENLKYMASDDTLQDEYDIMTGENETMEWISNAEGRGKAFTKYYQAIGIQIQCEEDNID